MTISVQQLRSAIPGAQPSQLDPGQVAFNVSDYTMYLGNGSDVRVDFSGQVVTPPPPAGKGWVQVLLERTALNDYFIANPESEGRPAPLNEQVLTYNAALGVAEWQDAGTGFAYTTTNTAVAGAAGATTSQKISTAIGSPAYIGQNATCIVTGNPGDTYEGLYIWNGTAWAFGAHYAFNTAAQVPATNPMTGAASNAQVVFEALETVDVDLQGQITSNDGDIATLQGQMAQAQSDINDLEINKITIASNAPSTGQILSFDGTGQLWVDDSQGDVTGVNATFPITVDNTDPQQPVVGINGASTLAAGAVQLSNSVSSTSELNAATPLAVKTAYDLADAAVPRASYTDAGDILVGTGAGFFGSLGVGTEGQILTVNGGVPAWTTDSPGDVTTVSAAAPITVDNTDPQNPVVGVNLATTATPGVVQVELTGNLTLVGGVINVPDASTTVKGAVQLNNTLGSTSTTLALTAAQGKALQDQIDALTLSNSVILAGGYNADTGVVDGVTSQGTAAGFVDGATPPLPSATNVDHYLICVVAGNTPSAMENGDWLLSVETSPGVYSYQVLGVGARPASASYTQSGIVQLADAATVEAGTSDTTAITPQSLQDNVIDSVTTVNSSLIASATAVNTAYVAGTTGQTQAAAAQATANAALPKAGGTMTGTIIAQNINVQATYALQFAGGVNGSVSAISDSTSTTSSTTAASATAVKAAYDEAVTASGQALGALAAAGAAQDTADAAIPKATFTAAGELLYGTGAGTYNVLPIGANGQSLIVSGGAIAWGSSLIGYTDQASPQNTALGFGAGDSVTTGLHNTAVGYNAGTAISAGDNNTFVGYLTGDGLTSGNNNTAVGASAFSNTGGSNNTVMGYSAGAGLSTGNSNTLIGSSAGDNIAGGNSIVGVGQGVLGAAVTAAGTVAIGATAGAVLTSAANTTLVGFAAGDSITTGARNTVVGHTSGGAITTGTDNTIVGATAANLASGTGSTIVGSAAGAALTLGGQNVFIGANAGDAVTTGFNNTIIGDVGGSTTLQDNVIIAAGTTIKFQANGSGAWSPNGVSYGNAGQVLTSQGSFQPPTWQTISADITAVNAGTGLTGGGSSGDVTLSLDPNAVIAPTLLTTTGDIIYASAASTPARLGIGTAGQVLTVAGGVPTWAAASASLSGCTLSATPFTTALGSGSGAALTSNSVGNTAIGYNTLDAEASGDFNVAVGHNALTAQNGASGNTALGANAGAAITNGLNNTLVGCGSGDALTSGQSNVAIGQNSLGTGTASSNNVAIGTGALGNGTATNGNSVAIGFNALTSLTTGAGNTAIGTQAGTSLSSGGANTFVGNSAGDAVTSGGSNAAFGWGALGTATTASGNTAIGSTALASATGGGNTAIGNGAGSAITTGNSNIILGAYSGTPTLENNFVVADGSGVIKFQVNENEAIGIPDGAGGITYGTAGQVLTSGGSGAVPTWTTPSSLTGSTTAVATALGVGALDSVIDPAVNNTALGVNAGTALVDGDRNTFVGYKAGQSVLDNLNNTFIGHQAGINSTGDGNTSVGAFAGPEGAALSCTFVGQDAGSIASGNNNVGVGASALSKATGGNNTAYGSSAGQNVTTGTLNTFIGFTAGSAVTTGSSNTILGDVNGTTTLSNNLILAAGTTIKLQVNENGAVGVGSTPAYGTSQQVLTSAGTGAAPTWETPVWLPLTPQTLTTTTPTTILTLPIATFRGVAINISASDATAGRFHNDGWMVIHDGASVSVQNSAPGAHIGGVAPYSLSATISGADLQIQVTSASANSTKYVGAYEAFAI